VGFEQQRVAAQRPTTPAADELQVSLRTLERWRQQGTGPAFIQVGRSAPTAAPSRRLAGTPAPDEGRIAMPVEARRPG
jgi:hypothetical protein